MEGLTRDPVVAQLSEAARVVAGLLADAGLRETLAQAAATCTRCLRAGGRIFLAGNGSSAAQAQAVAGAFVSRFAFDRPGLPAMALTADTSILTAIGNDYGFEQLFARQLQAHAHPGDVLIALSTSGQSRNILLVLEAARSLDVRRVGLTGNRGGPMRELCDHVLEVASSEAPRIQEGHLVLGHVLCGLVESAMFPKGR
jgi:D-sedoheptulose 7-phosphate isomerase